VLRQRAGAPAAAVRKAAALVSVAMHGQHLLCGALTPPLPHLLGTPATPLAAAVPHHGKEQPAGWGVATAAGGQGAFLARGQVAVGRRVTLPALGAVVEVVEVDGMGPLAAATQAAAAVAAVAVAVAVAVPATARGTPTAGAKAGTPLPSMCRSGTRTVSDGHCLWLFTRLGGGVCCHQHAEGCDIHPGRGLLHDVSVMSACTSC
jgi:hypothetical protein